VEVYSSEHEQVEALRRWWQKNGRTVLIALVLVLVAVFGWKTWQQQKAATSAAAAAEYDALLNAVNAGADEAGEIGRAIIAQYPDTPYAALSNLLLAATAVEREDLDAADAHLRWVMDNADTAELQTVARIRLARVELSRGNADAALKLVENLDDTGMGGYLAETKGDIHVVRGDEDKARDAYQQAREQYAGVPSKGPLVTMKLDDLAVKDDKQ